MSEIAIDNARSHNLAGASCRIPLGALTVITGVSGSGKSTLAFDTLYAEGQRRYVTSLSTYARQFLDRLPRPQVDRVSHLPPAIAIERRKPRDQRALDRRVPRPRSSTACACSMPTPARPSVPTVSTAVEPGTVEAVTGRILARFADATTAARGPAADPREGEGQPRCASGCCARGTGALLDADGELVEVETLAVKALDGHCAVTDSC